MKYLWIGVGNSDESRAEIIKNGGQLLSAEVSNDALVNGLQVNGVVCDTINSCKLPDYPHYPKKIVPAFEWTTESGAKCKSVRYLNYKYINLLSKRISLVREAKAWARENLHEDVTVFVYQMHTPFMAAAATVKKIIPGARIVLIAPDLPQYMDMNMSRFKKILKAIDWKSICKYCKAVDKYILYSRHMAEFLKLKEGSWIVMEGSFDPSILIEDNGIQKDSQKIAVMYSGVLDLRFGIRELLDAMNLLDDRYELWLTGNGNAVPLIKERANADPRICFYGFLPSRQDLLRKQHEATMLISTRDPSEVASRYCFPSKIFEYMASGNPVISTVIPGIPDEYFTYLVALPDINPETIAKKIQYIAEMKAEERCAFGTAAKEFVLVNKNNVAQAEKILKFVVAKE